ncbi:MAG TPA: LysM peptidoglycan-binding domain-containing protein, partial [Thermodesulfobacteriota bacterium]|nr:LysM peptidoglycan-binding domain-containing protein [Thermodesulfobacteriota bacterium]
PDMPNTVYKGDYLDPEEVDKRISEIKPIEQAEQADQTQAKKTDQKTAVTEEKPVPEEKIEIAEAGPADETSTGDISGNPGIEDVTETLPAEESGNEALEPGVEKSIEITEVTPDATDNEAEPAAPAEVKPAEKETLAAKSEEAPAPAVKEADKAPEALPAVETVQKPSPKEEVLTAEKSEAVKEDQKPAAEIKNAEKAKEPEIKLAEKPATPPEPKVEPAKIPVPEKGNTPLPGEYYTVRQGDSLWSIAHKFGKTTDELESLNGLTDSRLHIGEKILISGVGVTPLKPVTEVAVKKAEPVPAPPVRAEKTEPTPTLVTRSAAPVNPPVKTNIAADFNPKLATSAVAVRDTSVRVPEPIPQAAPPDRNSVYGFVTDYVSAYKNKDLDRVKALFMPDAVENGVSISRVISSYSSNFSNLDIMKYDVKVSGISVEKSLGYVRGEFFITFKDQRTGALKSSRGQINWTLSWTEGSWKIRELTYKIENTDTVG